MRGKYQLDLVSYNIFSDLQSNINYQISDLTDGFLAIASVVTKIDAYMTSLFTFVGTVGFALFDQSLQVQNGAALVEASRVSLLGLLNRITNKPYVSNYTSYNHEMLYLGMYYPSWIFENQIDVNNDTLMRTTIVNTDPITYNDGGADHAIGLGSVTQLAGADNITKLYVGVTSGQQKIGLNWLTDRWGMAVSFAAEFVYGAYYLLPSVGGTSDGRKLYLISWQIELNMLAVRNVTTV